MKTPTLKSSCCNAQMRLNNPDSFDSPDGQTIYYICKKCDMPCNFVDEKDVTHKPTLSKEAECRHSWMQDTPIKVCYHCGYKPNGTVSEESAEEHRNVDKTKHHNADIVMLSKEAEKLLEEDYKELLKLIADDKSSHAWIAGIIAKSNKVINQLGRRISELEETKCKQ